MKRRKFLQTMGLGAAAIHTAPNVLFAQQSREVKPNVVLVMTDDQGYGDLACHGNPIIKTPNLDKLYTQSVRLTNFHVSPTCSPTRASLMTGRYCNRTGVWHTIMGRSLLRKGEVTMADVFAANGYRTGLFGKWHLGDNYPFRPQDRGFHEVLTHGGGGVGNAQDYWGNGYFDDTYFFNGKPKKMQGYCTDVWFDEAMSFIENNKDKPFFCYLPTNAPHGPYRAPQKYVDMYKEKGLESPLAEFYGMITNIDDNMARLMHKLDTLDLTKKTILIFMTDNGSSIGQPANPFSAEMRAQKGSPYDGGHRVPLFIRWPDGDLFGGRDISELTAHIDVLPTLTELCGLQTPQNVKFDGKSLVSYLKGKKKDSFNRAIISDSQRVDFPKKWRKSAVMRGPWRLINGEELYDISKDPLQSYDVAKTNPNIVKELRVEYDTWWESISEDFADYPSIIVGSDKENPSCLTTHDIHGQVVWNQNQVKRGQRSDGFWAVEIERDGDYEISLRRWPVELNQPIIAAIEGGQAIPATMARLKIADIDVSKPIGSDAVEVIFKVRLKSGRTRLQTWFIDDQDDSKTYGVYYVYVKHLD